MKFIAIAALAFVVWQAANVVTAFDRINSAHVARLATAR